MTKIIFWASLGTIFYAYCGYIALTLLLAKLFGKEIKKSEIYPRVSIIVPCYNEQLVIRQKLENLASLDYPKEKLQIIIASESNDNTNNIVSEFKDKGIELYEYQSRRGKTTLLYDTVPKSNGEIIVFSDANTIYKKDAIKKLTRNFYEKNIGVVSGLLVFNNPEKSSISKGEQLYKKYETFLRSSDSLLRRVLNPDGSIFAMRKSSYRPIDAERGDDFELAMRAIIDGYDSVFEKEAIAYEDASITSKAESKRKIRMVSWFLKSSFILLKEMFSKRYFILILQLISHKLLRWFSPYFFLLLLISNGMLWDMGFIYRLLFIIQTAFYAMGLGAIYMSKVLKRKPSFVIGIAQYFLVFNYAFLVGTIRGLISFGVHAHWEKVRP